ncbi:MAG: hypothetical protein ACI9DJ_001324 [Algoriphagus sp.]|jgi:hypothetical protein
MSKRKFNPTLMAFIAILFCMSSCVEPYLKRFNVDQTIFIVDGKLTNDNSGNYIKLTEAIPNSGLSTSYLPVEKATVFVLENDENNILLSEEKPGEYVFPLDFKGQVGSSYQLRFTTANGKSFESKVETMESSAKIDKVYHSFDNKAIKDPQNTSPGQLVYIDTKDPGETEDFYMWDWVLYEQQFFCQTCIGGRYYRDASTGPLGECRVIRFRANAVLDYSCEDLCWDVIKPGKVNIMNDNFSNGKEIIGRLVAEIPIYQKIGSLLEIRQYGINKDVYNYLRLIESQGTNTGGLADTPPATLAGNITSTSNIDQAVAGYFIVSSVSKKLYWLDKTDIPNSVSELGLLGGRRPNPETMGNDLTRPPLAPCVNGPNRTNKEPNGWFNPASLF